MTLPHITLMTGNTMTHRLDIIAPEAVAACRALVAAGRGPVPGFPSFRVEVDGPLFTVWRGQEPIVTCGVGSDPLLWQSLVSLQRSIGMEVRASMPAAGRWLAVAILPGMAMLTQSDIGWLGDFERCMAAALLTNEPTKGLRPLPSGDAEGEAFRAAWLKHFPDTDNDSIIMLDNVAGLRVRGEDEFVCDDPDDPDAVLVVDVDDGKIYVSVEDAAHGKLHLETFTTPDELADYLKEKLEDR